MRGAAGSLEFHQQCSYSHIGPFMISINCGAYANYLSKKTAKMPITRVSFEKLAATNGIMQTLIITTCTNRKRLRPAAGLEGRNLISGTPETVAAAWRRALALHGGVASAPALRLYCGRAFTETLATVSDGDSFHVISAGLGLVASDQEVPAYSLTLARGTSDSVLDKLGSKFRPSDWWRALTSIDGGKEPLTELVRSNPGALVCVALSSQYLAMVQEDLLALTPVDLARLRICGPLSIAAVPVSLRPMVMPYDARFDGPDSPWPGTKSDFAARTLRHFVRYILPQSGAVADVSVHTAAVGRSLSVMRLPTLRRGRTVTDDEVMMLIRELWDESGGRSGAMLRLLRDTQNAACEQGRFSSLFKEAKRRFSL